MEFLDFVFGIFPLPLSDFGLGRDVFSSRGGSCRPSSSVELGLSFGGGLGRVSSSEFTHLGCFIEEEGRVIAQGCRDGRMFILDSTDGGTAMFAKGQKAESDIDLWHKHQRLQDLQSKQVVFALPKFSGRKAQICEAC